MESENQNTRAEEDGRRTSDPEGKDLPESGEPVKILSMDPGKSNFAWAYRENNTLIASGWITPMESVTDDLAFVNSYIELITDLNPNIIVLERFMVRNRGQSVHAELINQMIGRICILSRTHGPCETQQITAAQWKNWWNKVKKENWEDTYKDLDSVHKKDAAAMGQYIFEYWIDKNL